MLNPVSPFPLTSKEDVLGRDSHRFVRLTDLRPHLLVITTKLSIRRRCKLRFFMPDLIPRLPLFDVLELLGDHLWALHEDHAVAFDRLTLPSDRHFFRMTVQRNRFPSRTR